MSATEARPPQAVTPRLRPAALGAASRSPACGTCLTQIPCPNAVVCLQLSSRQQSQAAAAAAAATSAAAAAAAAAAATAAGRCPAARHWQRRRRPGGGSPATQPSPASRGPATGESESGHSAAWVLLNSCTCGRACPDATHQSPACLASPAPLTACPSPLALQLDMQVQQHLFEHQQHAVPLLRRSSAAR